MSKTFWIIAMDGGAGSGKSTTASLLSQRLDLMHVDTGLHYRSITKFLLDSEVEPTRVEDWINSNELELSSFIQNRKSFLLINEKRFVQEELRSELINQEVSKYASIRFVRELLFSYQRNQVELARQLSLSGVVMEGRDIGTIILPDADLKVFLYADERVRENRRLKEGESDQISSRDKLDSKRKIAPLRESTGSLRLDTSELDIEQVYFEIEKAIKDK